MADIPNFPSNSKTSKIQTPGAVSEAPASEVKAVTDTTKKIEKVIQGEAVRQKKPLGRKFAEAFTGEEARNVGHYVIFEVVLPGVKTLFFDTVTQGLERRLYGEVRRPSSVGRIGGYTSYNKMHSSPQVRREPAQISARARARHSFDEVILESRGDAEEVIMQLQAQIEQYDLATVSDLLQLIGSTPTYQDEKWGWTDLTRATTHRTSNGGYILNLPNPQPLT